MKTIKPSRVEAVARLREYQHYPKGKRLHPDFVGQGDAPPKCIRADTPIVALGSCFAMSGAAWLKRNRFSIYSPTLEAKGGACQIYNTASLSQEFQRVFGSFTSAAQCWTVKEGGEDWLIDPWRHAVAWENAADQEDELRRYTHDMRTALADCRCLILTVGQSEVWYDKVHGAAVYPMIPPDAVFDPQRHGFRLMGFTETLRHLNTVCHVFREHNKVAHIILTVSPIPLKATWRPGINAVVADTEQKAILRAAVGEFVATHVNVSYFPAFEIVKAHSAPYKADNRHVTKEAIADVMRVFESGYIQR